MQPRMTVEVRGNHLTLAGMIDETARLVRLLDHARDDQLVLDLGGITFINSLGIREWIRMQQSAERARLRLELVRVAEPIVHQLNIMPVARGVSLVTSFFAPYYCDNCDQDHAVLLDVRTHGTQLARKQPPDVACPDCKRPLELGEPPELYFTFLAG